MRRRALLAALTALTLAAAAHADWVSPVPEGKPGGPFLFAGVPWGTPADSLGPRLTAHGYREIPGGRQKERRQYEGRLFEHWSTLTARLDDQGRLIRWEIAIMPPTDPTRDPYLSQREIYDAARTEMESRYGRRRSGVEQFRFPYQKGDGREARALSEGLGTIRSEWVGRGGQRLTLVMDQHVAVTLTYASPQWAAVEKDRRHRKAKDF